MAYTNWVINGLTPSWVEPDFTDDRENRKLVLKCAAIYDETGNDPVNEIDSFNDISSEKINNRPLLNGGSKLQVKNGQIFSVTDGVNTWTKCALHRVNVTLDSYYSGAQPGSVIEYELTIEYETSGPGGSYVYTPPFNKAEYTNIEYYYFYDPGPPEVKSSGSSQGDLDGTEIGWMQITETKNVKRVELYGCGCDIPGSKIYVNDVEQIWHYGEIPGTDGLASGNEKLVWDLETPTTVITIKTTTHTLSPWANYGAWLQWVRVIYE